MIYLWLPTLLARHEQVLYSNEEVNQPTCNPKFFISTLKIISFIMSQEDHSRKTYETLFKRTRSNTTENRTKIYIRTKTKKRENIFFKSFITILQK